MNWSVAQAKAHLSEVLRRARAGEPQLIGAHDPCVVISRADFEGRASAAAQEHLGRWLTAAAAEVGAEIDLPPRDDGRKPEFPPED